MQERFDTIRRHLAVALVALLAAVAAIAAPSAGALTNCSPDSSWGTNRSDLAGQVVTLINQYRSGKGLSQLAVSSPLATSSQWKSLHMAHYGYFSHEDPAPPVARGAYQRATDCGYRGSTWGENIAAGYTTAQAVVNGWLGSSGHKANIENPDFTSTGVGVAANGSGQLYWTQSFGNDVSGGSPPTPPPSSPPPPPPPPPPPAPAPAPSPPPSAPTPPPPAPTAPAPSAPAPSAPTPGAPAPGAAPTVPGATPVAPGTPAPPAATTLPPAPTTAASGVLLHVGGKPARVLRQTRRSRLVALVRFVHLDTGRTLAVGSVRCRAEVSGKRLRVVTNAFARKAAKCAWRVPTWAKGKQLRGVVAVQVGDTAVRRLFVRTIR